MMSLKRGMPVSVRGTTMPNAPRQFKASKPRKAWERKGPDLRKDFRGAKRQAAKKRILERDGYICQICGCLLEGMKDSILDHIIPIARGGSHDDDNLASICKPCSARKTAKESRDGKN